VQETQSPSISIVQVVRKPLKAQKTLNQAHLKLDLTFPSGTFGDDRTDDDDDTTAGGGGGGGGGTAPVSDDDETDESGRHRRH